MNPGKKDKKCPKCESDLHYVEKVGQHYCFSCEAYFALVDAAEKEKAEEKKEALPVDEKKKVPEEKKPAEAKPEEAKPETDQGERILCPSCGETASLMDETKRYYCYSCEDYIDSEDKEKKRESEALTAPPAKEITEVPPAITEYEPVEKKEDKSAPEALIIKELEKEEVRNCQDCGSNMTYVQKYDRWYCRDCRKYAPKESAEEKAVGTRKCPTCGGEAKYIERYRRWYCWTCKEYLPALDVKPTVRKRTEGPTCPDCGKPATWIEQYARHYCYSCKKYLPKEEKDQKKKPSGPICPDCGKPTTWVQTYERYYCFPCKKYIQAGESKSIPERPKKAPARADDKAPVCDQCGKPTTWVAKYERHYCYSCKKYAPPKASIK